MSNVATILRNKAAELRITPESVAVQMLKEAGLSEQDAKYEVAQTLMEKEALSALTDKGIDIEEAVKLVKAANINVRELTNITFESESNPTAEILEKAAAYIETLESRVSTIEADNAQLIEDLEKAASEAAVHLEQPRLPDRLNKMASIGAFSNEDLEELKKISPEVLTKVASAYEEPWGLGGPAGASADQVDPLTAWLMSN
jgi:tRNA U34 5-carboxymethylaminomethyl modifying enzyme MnmG/GidA